MDNKELKTLVNQAGQELEALSKLKIENGALRKLVKEYKKSEEVQKNRAVSALLEVFARKEYVLNKELGEGHQLQNLATKGMGDLQEVLSYFK